MASTTSPSKMMSRTINKKVSISFGVNTNMDMASVTQMRDDEFHASSRYRSNSGLANQTHNSQGTTQYSPPHFQVGVGTTSSQLGDLPPDDQHQQAQSPRKRAFMTLLQKPSNFIAAPVLLSKGRSRLLGLQQAQQLAATGNTSEGTHETVGGDDDHTLPMVYQNNGIVERLQQYHQQQQLQQPELQNKKGSLPLSEAEQSYTINGSPRGDLIGMKPINATSSPNNVTPVQKKLSATKVFNSPQEFTEYNTMLSKQLLEASAKASMNIRDEKGIRPDPFIYDEPEQHQQTHQQPNHAQMTHGPSKFSQEHHNAKGSLINKIRSNSNDTYETKLKLGDVLGGDIPQTKLKYVFMPHTKNNSGATIIKDYKRNHSELRAVQQQQQIRHQRNHSSIVSANAYNNNKTGKDTEGGGGGGGNTTLATTTMNQSSTNNYMVKYHASKKVFVTGRDNTNSDLQTIQSHLTNVIGAAKRDRHNLTQLDTRSGENNETYQKVNQKYQVPHYLNQVSDKLILAANESFSESKQQQEYKHFDTKDSKEYNGISLADDDDHYPDRHNQHYNRELPQSTTANKKTTTIIFTKDGRSPEARKESSKQLLVQKHVSSTDVNHHLKLPELNLMPPHSPAAVSNQFHPSDNKSDMRLTQNSHSFKESSESKLRRILNTISFRNQALRILHESLPASRDNSPRPTEEKSLREYNTDDIIDEEKSVFREPPPIDSVSTFIKVVEHKNMNNSFVQKRSKSVVKQPPVHVPIFAPQIIPTPFDDTMVKTKKNKDLNEKLRDRIAILERRIKLAVMRNKKQHELNNKMRVQMLKSEQSVQTLLMPSASQATTSQQASLTKLPSEVTIVAQPSFMPTFVSHANSQMLKPHPSLRVFAHAIPGNDNDPRSELLIKALNAINASGALLSLPKNAPFIIRREIPSPLDNSSLPNFGMRAQSIGTIQVIDPRSLVTTIPTSPILHHSPTSATAYNHMPLLTGPVNATLAQSHKIQPQMSHVMPIHIQEQQPSLTSASSSHQNLNIKHRNSSNTLDHSRAALLYEHLMQDEMQKQIDASRDKKSKALSTKENMEKACEALKNENISLKKQVKRIKEMIEEAKSKPQQEEDYIEYSESDSELDDEEYNEENKETVAELPKAGQQIKVVEMGIHQKTPIGNVAQAVKRSFSQASGVSSSDTTSHATTQGGFHHIRVNRHKHRRRIDCEVFAPILQTIQQIFINPTITPKGAVDPPICPIPMIEEFQKYMDVVKQMLACDDVCIIMAVQGLYQKFMESSQEIITKQSREHQIKQIYIEDMPLSVVTRNLPHDDVNIVQQTYQFKKRRHMEQGIYKQRYMLIPIFDRDEREILACIQVSKVDELVRTGKSKNPDFDESCRVRLKLFATLFRLRLEGVISRIDSRDYQRKVVQIMSSCHEILSAKTLYGIIRAMRKELSRLFDFEGCVVFFNDYGKNDMFTYITDLNKDLKTLVDAGAGAKCKFPTTLGMTGSALTMRNMQFSNSVEGDPKIIADVDNILKFKPMRNFMAFEVPAFHISITDDDETGFIPVGVVQLANKREDHAFPYITNKDIKIVNALRPFLGACMHSINIINSMVNLILDMEQSRALIEKMVNRNDLAQVLRVITLENMIKNFQHILRNFDVMDRPNRVMKQELEALGFKEQEPTSPKSPRRGVKGLSMTLAGTRRVSLNFANGAAGMMKKVSTMAINAQGGKASQQPKKAGIDMSKLFKV